MKGRKGRQWRAVEDVGDRTAKKRLGRKKGTKQCKTGEDGKMEACTTWGMGRKQRIDGNGKCSKKGGDES